MKSCKYFKGDRPCKYYWIDRSWDCDNCSHHTTYSERILLIKLDELGDVVRSTALVEGLRKTYQESQITWLVAKSGKYFLQDNPNIDRILEYNNETIRQLQCEKFDLIINLDKDSKATSLITILDSDVKRGYGINKDGCTIPLNQGTNDSYYASLDNWGKKIKETKSYQELIFDISEIKYSGEKPKIFLNDGGKFKDKFYEKYNIKKDDNLIIFNTGSSPKYKHRVWTKNGYRELAKKLLLDKKNKIILTGSDLELERNNYIAKGLDVINTTSHYNIKEFVFLLQLSDLIVTGETSAMHIGISLSKKIIGFWGSLPPNLVNLYGLGTKHYLKDLDCLGCYGQFECPYDAKCMKGISVDEVYKSIGEIIWS